METLRYIVLVNGLLAVLSVAFYVLLRRETFFGANRLMLWLIVVTSFAGPLLELPDWRPQPMRDVMHRTARVIVPKVLPNRVSPQPDVTITFPNGKTYPAVKSASTLANWSWQQGLVVLYLLGMLGLLIRFVIQLFSLYRLIQHSAREPYDDFTVLRNESIRSPFSFFKHVFINPLQHTPDELEQILRHERVHVQARHSLDMIGAELVCLVLWFNPAAYLFRHLLHQTLEFSADRAVLAEGIDAIAYQYNLLKVSLSGSSSVITNHFSKSQLKSRIVMLNKRQSSVMHGLKYPVLVFTALTMATAFARPQLKTLKRYLPKQVERVASVREDGPNKIAQPVIIQPVLIERKARINKNNGQEVAGREVAQLINSISKQQSASDSVRVSPSRYIVYKGDFLYWIVTPKTTFDDFAVMKQEFAKLGHTMQLNEIKYDPLYAFIDRIVITIQRPTGGMTRVNELDGDNKPIPTVAGYISVKPSNGGSGTGALKALKNDFPDRLRAIADAEEATIDTFYSDHRLDYLIYDGELKFKNLGSGSSTYSKAFFKNRSTRSSGLIINPDGSLMLNEELGSIQVFINNEPVEPKTLTNMKVDQLYSVVKKMQYNPARKESFTSAVLIYTTTDN